MEYTMAEGSPSSARPTPAIELRGVGKRYHSAIAVDQVDLDVAHGEVHGLMGENGAGKSTVMKAIAGNFTDYTGEILIDGRPTDLHSPAAARAHGIAMVYQELSLAGPLSIAENVFAGREGPVRSRRSCRLDLELGRGTLRRKEGPA